ncbi:MAG: hypothetical protein ACJAUP_002020 [Cellvibrionaceae bacterium]
MIDLTPKPGSNRSQLPAQATSSNSTAPSPSSPVTSKTSHSAASASASSNAKADNNLSAVLNLLKQLPEGTTLEAQVKSSQILSHSDKALLQQSNPSLAAKLSQNTSKDGSLHNALNSKGFGHTDQKIQSTNLFLAKLSVSLPNTKALLITTVTAQALKINDAVIVGQRNQKLLISQTPSQQIQQIAIETIKQILPKQQSTHLLQQFVQQLSSLPKPLQSILLTNTSQAAIQQLTNFTHTNSTLQHSQAVKLAIANSGTQLEAKVNSQQALTSDLRALLNNIINRIDQNQSSPLVKNPSVSHPPHNNIASQTGSQQNTLQASVEAKANLIQTPKESEKLISALLTALPNNTASVPLSNNTQALNLHTATAALMRLLGVPAPPEGQLLTALPKIIEQHLKQLIEKTQARIQLNQLRSLGLDKAISENRSTLVQQFHTELPLRFNEQVLPVQITIQEQEYKNTKEEQEEAENQNQEKGKKARRWQVFMSFDLPNTTTQKIEILHTKVNIIDDTVSATLWAESNTLCKRANKNLAYLRDKLLAKGLKVDDITCLQGKPPQQDFSLEYNLVDIKT